MGPRKMQNEYHIATGRSANSSKWTNQTVTWEWLINKLHNPTRTQENYSTYMSLARTEQARIKDTGGFVAGYLTDGVRGKHSVHCRSMVTLDVDFAPINFIDYFRSFFYGVKAVIHGTHKHSENSPRLRLIIPLSRIVTPDEYQAVARFVASKTGEGLKWYDKTTFQPERLMFWPSISFDSNYYYEELAGQDLNVDAVLAQYIDWRDVSAWPKHPEEIINVSGITSQQNPLDKKGPVGDFCRVYTISKAIDTFLSDIYEYSGDGRYTYKHGTSTSGAVVYDDTFIYSHHGSDPAAMQLLNAFDLVRIHKYGKEDADKTQTGSKAKSYKEMVSLMTGDANIKVSKFNDAMNMFSGVKPTFTTSTTKEAIEENWQSKLTLTKQMVPEPNVENIEIILKNDPNLKGLFMKNDFDERVYVMRQPPWCTEASWPTGTIRRSITDDDTNGLNCYLNKVYKFWTPNMTHAAFSCNVINWVFNPVKDFIESEKWDGVPRIETIFQNVFGAADTQLTRQIARKFFTAGVKRIYEPGCKYDNVTVIYGPEGTGKSTFFQTIAGDWFSDSFSFDYVSDTQKVVEQLKNKWILEVPEMRGMKSVDDNRAKSFISAQVDTTREAYGRNPRDNRRKSILAGTTNNEDFLKLSSGNRRYWIIEVIKENIKFHSWSVELKNIVGQLWAEALTLYRSGETLMLDHETEQMAAANRIRYTETDTRTGIVSDFLDKPLPENYESMSHPSRVQFFNQPPNETGRKREYVSRLQIFAECFGRDHTTISRKDTYEIGQMMKELPDWQPVEQQKRIAGYSKQRVYYNKKNAEYNLKVFGRNE